MNVLLGFGFGPQFNLGAVFLNGIGPQTRYPGRHIAKHVARAGKRWRGYQQMFFSHSQCVTHNTDLDILTAKYRAKLLKVTTKKYTGKNLQRKADLTGLAYNDETLK